MARALHQVGRRIGGFRVQPEAWPMRLPVSWEGSTRGMVRPSFHSDRSVTVGVSVLGPVVVVGLAGEIDIATRAAVADPIFACVDEGPPGMVIDLTKVGFIGSTGFDVLKDANQRAKRNLTVLRIVASTPVVLRSLKVSGLLTMLPMCDSMPEALSRVSEALSGVGNAGIPRWSP